MSLEWPSCDRRTDRQKINFRMNDDYHVQTLITFEFFHQNELSVC